MTAPTQEKAMAPGDVFRCDGYEYRIMEVQAGGKVTADREDALDPTAPYKQTAFFAPEAKLGTAADYGQLLDVEAFSRVAAGTAQPAWAAARKAELLAKFAGRPATDTFWFLPLRSMGRPAGQVMGVISTPKEG
jgi:hypothetical protein